MADVRREETPLLWSTAGETALARGFWSNMGNTKYPCVCRLPESAESCLATPCGGHESSLPKERVKTQIERVHGTVGLKGCHPHPSPPPCSQAGADQALSSPNQQAKGINTAPQTSHDQQATQHQRPESTTATWHTGKYKGAVTPPKAHPPLHKL